MKLTIQPARWVLRRAMQTQGEGFVYCLYPGSTACLYRPITSEELEFDYNGDDPGDPRRLTGCLVGAALSLWGEDRHLNTDTNVIGLGSDYPDMMTDVVIRYFDIAQRAQDGGVNWGAAYAAAERYYYMHLSYCTE